MLSSSFAVAERVSAQSTSLLSIEGDPLGTDGRGYTPSISADGRFVAFWDGLGRLLVRDLRAGRAVVASPEPDPVDDQPLPRAPGRPSLSADGRSVAFDSAGRLVPDDRGGEVDVFVRDLATESTTLASRASGADGAPGNAASFAPSISDDGRFVAFMSSASNLAADDTETPAGPTVGFDPGFDVFVRDLQTQTTTLVSRASGATGADGNGPSAAPAISADGRFVAFQSFAANLGGEDDDARADIYVRDLETAATMFVGRGSAAIGARAVLEDAGPPAISSDGRLVAFSTLARFGGAPLAFSQDVLFVRNLQRRTTTVVSVTPRGAISGGLSPSLSSDGRYIAFSSGAPDLQPYLTAPFPDIFVRDLERRTTTLASRAANRLGTPGNGGSHAPSISDDGRFVVFESRSSNLHPLDGDRSGDVFLRDLGAPPFEQPARAYCAGRRAGTIMLTGAFPFRGTTASDVVAGSRESDRMTGGPGRDQLCGRRGRDQLTGGPGRDRIAGGAGRDLVRSADKSRDSVDCGPGRDAVIADALDGIRRCERIRTRAIGRGVSSEHH